MTAKLSFGEKLQHLRKESGKSQAEVAKEIAERFPGISISQTKISTLEQAETAPRIDLLEALSSYFGIPVTYFFDSTTEDEQVDKALRYLEELKVTAPFGQELLTHREHFREATDQNTDERPDTDEYLDT